MTVDTLQSVTETTTMEPLEIFGYKLARAEGNDGDTPFRRCAVPRFEIDTIEDAEVPDDEQG